MNWMQRLLNLPRSGRASPDSSCIWFVGNTQAGAYVDQDTALNYSAVWACVRIISETIAQLPWKTYQSTGRGKKEVDAAKNDVAWMLKTQPNPETTAFRFKRTMVAHALVWGNAYCEIERDGSGRPVWLWPISPARVKVDRDSEGNLIYRVSALNGGQETILRANDVLHLRGLGDDDVVGTSVLAKAKQSIGLGIAMEQFGSSFFGNGANMGGALKHPKSLGPEARKNLEDSLKKRAGGKNALSTIVLEEGMSYERIGIPPEDAQFLESRKFQVLEICRWFRVPPHKLAELDRATWNNIEHQGIEFVTDTIVPWTCNLEEEANLKLFGRQNRGVYYTKFSLNALLRGDTKSRFEAYAIGRQWGWLNPDDIREMEDLNPLPKGQGKLYLVPSNMTTPEGLEKMAQAPQQSLPFEDDESNDSTMAAVKRARLLNAARAK